MPLPISAATSASPPAAPSTPAARRLPLALLLPLAGVLGAMACDSNLACPPGYGALGNFTVGFTAVDAGAACIITRTTDGGPADASLTGTPAAALMLLCGAATDAGEVALAYSFRGSGTHSVTLDGGVFTQSTTATGQTGSACLCPLDLTETITGTPKTADGGPLRVEADGGLGVVTGITGTFTEGVAASGGSTACACTLPCVAGYTFSSQ
jgi:hypothetical protein